MSLLEEVLLTHSEQDIRNLVCELEDKEEFISNKVRASFIRKKALSSEAIDFSSTLINFLSDEEALISNRVYFKKETSREELSGLTSILMLKAKKLAISSLPTSRIYSGVVNENRLFKVAQFKNEVQRILYDLYSNNSSDYFIAGLLNSTYVKNPLIEGLRNEVYYETKKFIEEEFKINKAYEEFVDNETLTIDPVSLREALIALFIVLWANKDLVGARVCLNKILLVIEETYPLHSLLLFFQKEFDRGDL